MVYSKKSEFRLPGNKTMQWNGSNAESGTYIVKVVSGRMESTEKVILNK
jgi:hypothetical protein